MKERRKGTLWTILMSENPEIGNLIYQKKKILQHVTHSCQHTTQHQGFSDCENSLVNNEHF